MPRLLAAMPVVFVLLWSTGWIAAKYAAFHADPLWFLTIRFACAGVLLAAVAFVFRAPWPSGARAWGHAIIAGVLIHGIYLGGVWWAVKHGLSAGLSGLLAALQPLMTALLAPWLLKEVVSGRQWLGVGIGFLGVLLVLSPKLGLALGASAETAWVAVFVNVIGMVSATAGAFYQKRFGGTADLRTGTSVQYLGAVLVVGPLALLLEPLHFDHSLTAYAVLAWSVVVLSGFTIWLMLLMISKGELARVSALLYLVPSTVALQAWGLFGETLNALQTVGMVTTALGVYLATSRRFAGAR